MKYLIFIVLLLSCKSSKFALSDYNTHTNVSKTYLYLGNEFVDKYHSKIDTVNYSWKDSIVNGKLISRYYPKYQGQYERHEKSEYFDDGSLKKVITETLYSNDSKTLDSLVYKKKNGELLEKSKFENGKCYFKWLESKSNDTIYIDNIFGDKYGFTERLYWETKSRKHKQIIKPDLSKVLNIFVYNDKGDLKSIERYENDEFVEISMVVEYIYDQYSRIVSESTFDIEGENKIISSKKITIFE